MSNDDLHVVHATIQTHKHIYAKYNVSIFCSFKMGRKTNNKNHGRKDAQTAMAFIDVKRPKQTSHFIFIKFHIDFCVWKRMNQKNKDERTNEHI